MSAADHYAMRLNNFLQGRYGSAASRKSRYEETHSGPQNHTEWKGIYFIQDTIYGTGTGTNKRAAKEAAAKKTIEKLEKEGHRIP